MYRILYISIVKPQELSTYVLYNMVATIRRWLLSTWNVVNPNAYVL